MLKYLIKCFDKNGDMALQLIVPAECLMCTIEELPQDKYVIKANVIDEKEDV